MIGKTARAVILILILVHPLHAETEFRLDVAERRLGNGLTILMLEHRIAPIVACSMFYRVGSVNEEPGRTGITHMLEHMMFKGTRAIGTRDYSREEPLLKRIEEIYERTEELERVGGERSERAIAMLREELERLERRADELTVKNELWKIYMRRGADDLNAYTGRDRTQYITSLPANQLELWMWLESDRMANAVFREFYREREVILEERRLTIDDSPSGSFAEQMQATSFIAHPYRWPIIGWESDIAQITPPMLEAWYRRYYAPNNAILVIVGDIEIAEVTRMAERYFGRIPAQPPPPPVVTKEPEQRGKRENRLALDASPRIALAFHKPAVASPDNVALDVLETILASGRTSRLYRGLVEGRKIAVSASVSSPPTKYPSLFVFFCIPRRPHTVDEVEKAIWEEIGDLLREPVGEWELQKARNQIEADFVRGIESAAELSTLIGTFEAIYKWEYLNTYIPMVRAVGPDDLARVVRTYLKEEKCTKVVIP